ncbi:hypothetical protein HDU96_006755 [Phlyctochytrium bullatum]|nr:hypothetical protein HDU96_006755 [Phlyctochytrium bullatum]
MVEMISGASSEHVPILHANHVPVDAVFETFELLRTKVSASPSANRPLKCDPTGGRDGFALTLSVPKHQVADLFLASMSRGQPLVGAGTEREPVDGTQRRPVDVVQRECQDAAVSDIDVQRRKAAGSIIDDVLALEALEAALISNAKAPGRETQRPFLEKSAEKLSDSSSTACSQPRHSKGPVKAEVKITEQTCDDDSDDDSLSDDPWIGHIPAINGMEMFPSPCALHKAATLDDHFGINQLLAARADPHEKDAEGRLPIECTSSVDIWRALSAKMAPTTLTLLEAVKRGDGVTVRRLLAAGHNIRDADRDGVTALHHAAAEGHEDIARVLLHFAGPAAPLLAATSATAELDLSRRSSTHRVTPLHLAAAFNHKNVAKLLLQHGATVDGPTHLPWTPLHVAARNGNTEMCRFLLDRGADVGRRDNRGCTALHLAAGKGREVTCKLLMAWDSTTVEVEDEDGSTALHHAVAGNHLAAVKALVAGGASVSAKNKFGRTPPKYAAALNFDRIVAFFKEKRRRRP